LEREAGNIILMISTVRKFFLGEGAEKPVIFHDIFFLLKNGLKKAKKEDDTLNQIPGEK